MPYIGNPIYQAAFVTDQFSGDGTTTAFTMSVAPAGTSNVLVVVSGVVQDPSTYGVVGTTLTFTGAPPSGTGNISCRYLGVPATGVTTTAYRTVTEFTATAAQTTFTPPSYDVGFINVYRNGVLLGSADYTATNGTTVVLATGATAGDLITVESFLISSVANAISNTAGSVNSTNIADGAVGTAEIADGAVTAAKLDSGLATQWVTSGANISYTTGNVGVGTSTSVGGLSEKLSVLGSKYSTSYPFIINSADTAAYNAGTNGGGIGFSYKYNTAGDYASGPAIQGFKENTTDGNYASGLRFLTRPQSSDALERMRIDSAGRVTMPYQPIFYAAQRTSSSSGAIVSFALTPVNIGGHFNGTRFTCPVAGTYRFYWSSLFGGSATVGRFWLYKNGSYAYADNSGDGVLLRIDNSTNIGFPQGERTVTITASAGDYFEIYFQSDNGSTNGSSGGYTVFSGELIG